ncbi:M20/M25/M40 family metallo-hydrolase [Qipengyuania zhejiangensis]|uniref:M20/M25/M40 family metallo-hydrolase n=1 Tax=Qipengyuania zhejiangensis TaxID=3077782 RepID=UPI002D77353C|nr:M20/M25/M40 family metallo-hydrolase [Qipengyuania sp. Z2]
MKTLVLLAAAAIATPVLAQSTGETSPDPAAQVSTERLRADIDTLVGFGTRHTLSEQDNPARGIGAAVDWGLAEFGRIGTGCGGCLEIVAPERVEEGRRLPHPTRIRNAVAIQRGYARPNEVVIVQGHIDSRGTDPLDWQTDAPGANDDGSGTVLVLEAARNLSQHRYPVTIVYALLSGEEQGLYGGRLMADYAQEQGWQVKAVLNNDIVGGSCGSDGYCDANHVRVFSEGSRADLTQSVRAAQRREGGENDTPSRNLSRYIDSMADRFDGGLDVRQIWRTDRMGRGGDQIPFLEKGYPAVRITVAVEDYEHQHQDLRTQDGIVYGDTPHEMDFAYLAKVTQLNIRALDSLARTPMPPAPVVDAAVRTDTLISWQGVEGASGYSVVARRTDEPGWTIDGPIVSFEQPTQSRPVTPQDKRRHSVTMPLRGDDYIFGVYSYSQGGASPVASAVPAGQFGPLDAVEDDSE